MNSEKPDLLRKLRQQSSVEGSGRPVSPKSGERIVVTPNGLELVRGSGKSEQISELPGGVWAAVDAARLTRECAIAEKKLPRGAWWEEVDGVAGWYYEFRSPQGDLYTMFLYFDESVYKVHLVYPVPARAASPGTKHLFDESGEICLNNQHGYPRMEDAYARSVEFAAGFSEFERSGRWPLG